MNSNELLIQFLMWLITSGGSALAVYATMEQLKRLWPTGRAQLSGDAKFYIAVALSIAYPLLAYAVLSLLTNQPLNLGGWFAALAAGYVASQKLHRNDAEPEKQAMEARLANLERQLASKGAADSGVPQ